MDPNNDRREVRYLATDGRLYGNDTGQWDRLEQATFFETPQEAQKAVDEFRTLWGKYSGIVPNAYVAEVTLVIRPHKS